MVLLILLLVSNGVDIIGSILVGVVCDALGRSLSLYDLREFVWILVLFLRLL